MAKERRTCYLKSRVKLLNKNYIRFSAIIVHAIINLEKEVCVFRIIYFRKQSNCCRCEMILETVDGEVEDVLKQS